MLPYFAGERTPFADPAARGAIFGLRLDHTRGDIYRAALEATAFGVRHNVEAMREAGGQIDRVVAIGGGTRGGLWTQIVSDVTQLEQVIPARTIGASYGVAFLAAASVEDVHIAAWNPIEHVTRPDSDLASRYDELYGDYRELYESTATIAHRLDGRD